MMSAGIHSGAVTSASTGNRISHNGQSWGVAIIKNNSIATSGIHIGAVTKARMPERKTMVDYQP